MNRKELSNVYYLGREIERLNNMIEEMEAVAFDTTSKLSGAYGGSLQSDKVGNAATKLADLRTQRDRIYQKRIGEYVRLTRFIDGIEDAQIRLICQLRFLDCMTWNQVADFIGGGNTEDSVRMICNRYIKKL